MKNKVIVLAVLLVGLAVTAQQGFETYAKFVSQATSSSKNTIKLGKVEINNKRNNIDLGTWIDSTSEDSQIKKPGEAITLKTISIDNTGDINMLVNPKIDISFIKELKSDSGEVSHTTVQDLNQFMISPSISIYTNTIQALGLADKDVDKDGYVTVKEFKDALDSFEGFIFKPEDGTVTIGGILKLDQNADNDYQGASVTANLIVTGEQV
jgi:hypothetical protein